MIKGPIVTAVVTVVAMTAVVAAFMTNASPYVTIAQARKSNGNRLHLAGDMVKGSIKSDLVNHTVSFQILDADKATITVDHHGEAVNLAEATKVVAIGHMNGERFVSEKLLLKCPSRYESEDKPKFASR